MNKTQTRKPEEKPEETEKKIDVKKEISEKVAEGIVKALSKLKVIRSRKGLVVKSELDSEKGKDAEKKMTASEWNKVIFG